MKMESSCVENRPNVERSLDTLRDRSLASVAYMTNRFQNLFEKILLINRRNTDTEIKNTPIRKKYKKNHQPNMWDTHAQNTINPPIPYLIISSDTVFSAARISFSLASSSRFHSLQTTMHNNRKCKQNCHLEI